MSAFSVSFLGSPRFMKDGHHAPLVRAKGVALLLYLAVTRAPQSRDRLLDLLWPDSLPDAARKNLRNTLWTIREVLGEEVIEAVGDTLCLSDSVAVDVHALEDAVSLPQNAGVSALESVAEQYRGPLADGLVVREAPDFEIWLATERERVNALYLRLLARTVPLHRSAGDWQRVIVFAQRALAIDPLREPAHLAMIEAMLRLGQRSQAVRQYDALVAILERELAVAPLPETSERYHALLAGQDAVPARLAPIPPAAPSPRDPAPLVGRQEELGALDAARALAGSGQARVVLISGDLGMGKSRLWQAWAGMHHADTAILATYAIETAEPVPFGPVLSLFTQPGPAHDLLRPPTPLAPIWLAELARLMPEIRSAWPHLAPPLGLAAAEGRARLFQALTEAFRTLIESVVHRHPLVLVVDDLHWADPSTLDWLVYLVDRLQDLPLLLVGAYRPQDAPARLNALAAAWQRQDRLETIGLPHLTPEEAYALLVSLGIPGIDKHRDEWVHQSGGNPYFLIELSRRGSGEPPADLAAPVRSRLQSTVPAPALQTLQAAAVLGTVDEVELLRATSGRTEEETLDGLDALVAAGVLVARAEGGYGFAQPLVARVVREELTPARRAFLHRRAARALETGAAGDAQGLAGRLMRHYAGAGEPKRAAAYAELAARHALNLSAFGEAALYAQRALDMGGVAAASPIARPGVVGGGERRSCRS